ncbi:hypothetical protein ACFQER_07205 [Halomicroarcula sp. GCM10025894]|uniref:hypothetical protein n=1 Tax=Halomicroarcula sp. GCM10025894 TaxID=3252673 RepID=UPI0036096FFB
MLRREYGGNWRHTETDGLQLELPISDGAARVSPIAMAEACLAGDDTFTERYAGVSEVLEEVGDQLRVATEPNGFCPDRPHLRQ